MGKPKIPKNQYSCPWKKSEEKILKDNFNKLNYEEISNLLNRSKEAVRFRCNSMGLHKSNRWTESELELLRENYNKLSNTQLSKIISKHPQSSISDKMVDLVLKREEVFIKKLISEGAKKNKGVKWSKESRDNLSKIVKTQYQTGGRSHPNLGKKIKKSGIEKGKKTFRKNWNEERRKQYSDRAKKQHLKNPKNLENMRVKLAIDRKINPKKYLMSKNQREKFIDPLLDENRREKIRKTINQFFSKNKIIDFCECCGKKIINSRTNKYKKRFCSIKCGRSVQITPTHDTSIEIKIQDFLKELGMEFFTHQYIRKIEHSYQCDILIPSMNLVIECDGDYWHNYPNGNEIDHLRTKELLDKGFKILRLWECEINKIYLKDFKKRLFA